MKSENIYLDFIKRVLDKIEGKEENDITISPLSSFANSVYRVEVKNNSVAQIKEKEFLLKVYRSYLDQFSNKQIENQVVSCLAAHKEYPEVFYADKSYRIQKFITAHAPSVQTITEEQLMEIASKLANLVKLFDGHFEGKSQFVQNQRKISNMFAIFQGIKEHCKGTWPSSYEICKQFVESVLRKDIKQNLQKMVPEKLVPTHNDCHFHNILIENESKKLYLIDYEFFSMNYRGFELGNLFNQYATDYCTFEIKEELELPESKKEQMIKVYYQQIAPQMDMKECCQEVLVGRLLSHLFWLFIGVKQVKDPKITIDMQYYIRRRYEEFMKIYKRMLAEK